MKTIKFSHDYEKLPLNAKTATLLDVQCINLEDQTPAFMEYDTKFINQKNGEIEHYPLPKTSNGRLDYMILLMRSDTGAFFTTIRRRTPAKDKYYCESIGEKFEIAIEAEA